MGSCTDEPEEISSVIKCKIPNNENETNYSYSNTPRVNLSTTISCIIWIDPSIDNSENSRYRKELDSIWFIKAQYFKNVKDAINFLKQIQFVETKIILGGKIFVEFLETFFKNLNEINVVPKIIIFTKEKDSFIKQNEKYKEYMNHAYYSFGGIKTSFEEIKTFILNKKEENVSQKTHDNVQMIF